jgi:ubiquinone/menaquinone biosynthesis C-methylase UbiE
MAALFGGFGLLEADMEFTGERLILGKGSNATQEHHLARYHFCADHVRGKVVLDVACGAGYGSQILKKAGAKNVTGVDVSKESIAFAKKEYGMPGISFIASDATKLRAIKTHSIDVAVSFETIEHLPMPELFLKELNRVMKLDATLIISNPDPRLSSKYNLPRAKPENPFHFKEYTESELIAMLAPYWGTVRMFGQGFFSEFMLRYPVQVLNYGLWKVLKILHLKKLNEHPYTTIDATVVPQPSSSAVAKYWVFICTR